MDKPCEFCGSKTRLISTGYYARPDDAEPAKTPCCNAQKRNMDFIRKRELTGEEAENVSKL